MTVKSRLLLAAALLILVGCGDDHEAAAEPSVAAPKVASQADADLGERTYANLCVTCHGPGGRGDGQLVGGLPIKPRSFAADDWRFVDFTTGDAAVRVTIERVLREGISDAMMPPYATTLSDTQITAVVDHVLELRRRGRGG